MLRDRSSILQTIAPQINKRADSISGCQPCGCSGSFASFRLGLLCEGRDLLWSHGPVVDADVVNRAGPEGSGFRSFAGANVQAVT